MNNGINEPEADRMLEDRDMDDDTFDDSVASDEDDLEDFDEEMEDDIVVAIDEGENERNEEEQPAAGVGEDAEQAQRRQAIQLIMRDGTLSDDQRRHRIQALAYQGSAGYHSPLPISDADLPATRPASEIVTTQTCVHYERKCYIVAPCCNRIFGCRICHDEFSPQGHPPMNRFLIREVVCKICNLRQKSSNQCVNCKATFAEYHCDHCNLWMAMSKRPYHCNECGICRVGGSEEFRHCSECCMCISASSFDAHTCRKDKYKDACPVCFEELFGSRHSPQDLPCGHALHAHCFRILASYDYRCPICKKAAVSSNCMANAWEARSREIEEHPMPEELCRTVDIICNDCETRSLQRAWHFLGIQCPRCNSFNTVEDRAPALSGVLSDDTSRSSSSSGS